MAKFTITQITITTTEIDATNYSEAKTMVDKIAPVEWRGRRVIQQQQYKEIKEDN